MLVRVTFLEESGCEVMFLFDPMDVQDRDDSKFSRIL